MAEASGWRTHLPPPSPLIGGKSEAPSFALPPSEGEPNRFEVRDDAALAWVVRRLADARSRISENRATAAKLIADIDAWLDKETEGDQRDADHWESLATCYLARLTEANPRLKSKRTAWGVVQSRAQFPEYKRDEPTLRAWALENGYVRECEPAIDWAGIKAATSVKGERLVLPGGEVVPGCRVVPRPRRFEVVALDE